MRYANSYVIKFFYSLFLIFFFPFSSSSFFFLLFLFFTVTVPCLICCLFLKNTVKSNKIDTFYWFYSTWNLSFTSSHWRAYIPVLVLLYKVCRINYWWVSRRILSLDTTYKFSIYFSIKHFSSRVYLLYLYFMMMP